MALDGGAAEEEVDLVVAVACRRWSARASDRTDPGDMVKMGVDRDEGKPRKAGENTHRIASDTQYTSRSSPDTPPSHPDSAVSHGDPH